LAAVQQWGGVPFSEQLAVTPPQVVVSCLEVMLLLVAVAASLVGVAVQSTRLAACLKECQQVPAGTAPAFLAVWETMPMFHLGMLPLPPTAAAPLLPPALIRSQAPFREQGTQVREASLLHLHQAPVVKAFLRHLHQAPVV